jgi:Short-chain dehydrogenases of various substrate specificities
MARIVITGASSGIGYQTALNLVTQGHQVLALARSEHGLRDLKTAAEKHSGRTRFAVDILPFDVVWGAYTESLVPFVRDHLGELDVLINNAGLLINKPFEETSDSDFLDLFRTNVQGPANMTRHLLPLMSRGSHIVNIGSMGGFQGSVKFPGLSAYSATKAALHALTECLAAELADRDIKINCLALGSAQTEMLQKAFPQYKSPVTASAMGEYIAHFALAGHRFFNGKVLPVAVTTP